MNRILFPMFPWARIRIAGSTCYKCDRKSAEQLQQHWYWSRRCRWERLCSIFKRGPVISAAAESLVRFYLDSTHNCSQTETCNSLRWSSCPFKVIHIRMKPNMDKCSSLVIILKMQTVHRGYTVRIEGEHTARFKCRDGCDRYISDIRQNVSDIQEE